MTETACLHLLSVGNKVQSSWSARRYANKHVWLEQKNDAFKPPYQSQADENHLVVSGKGAKQNPIMVIGPFLNKINKLRAQ